MLETYTVVFRTSPLDDRQANQQSKIDPKKKREDIHKEVEDEIQESLFEPHAFLNGNICLPKPDRQKGASLRKCQPRSMILEEEPR